MRDQADSTMSLKNFVLPINVTFKTLVEYHPLVQWVKFGISIKNQTYRDGECAWDDH